MPPNMSGFFGPAQRPVRQLPADQDRLLVAVASGDHREVVALLELGARPSIRANDGRLPEDVALAYGHHGLAFFLATVRLMQERGWQPRQSWDELTRLADAIAEVVETTAEVGAAANQLVGIGGESGGVWILGPDRIQCYNLWGSLTDVISLDSVTGFGVHLRYLPSDFWGRRDLNVHTASRVYVLSGVKGSEAEKFGQEIMRRRAR